MNKEAYARLGISELLQYAATSMTLTGVRAELVGMCEPDGQVLTGLEFHAPIGRIMTMVWNEDGGMHSPNEIEALADGELVDPVFIHAVVAPISRAVSFMHRQGSDVLIDARMKILPGVAVGA